MQPAMFSLWCSLSPRAQRRCDPLSSPVYGPNLCYRANQRSLGAPWPPHRSAPPLQNSQSSSSWWNWEHMLSALWKHTVLVLFHHLGLQEALPYHFHKSRHGGTCELMLFLESPPIRMVGIPSSRWRSYGTRACWARAFWPSSSSNCPTTPS